MGGVAKPALPAFGWMRWSAATGRLAADRCQDPESRFGSGWEARWTGGRWGWLATITPACRPFISRLHGFFYTVLKRCTPSAPGTATRRTLVVLLQLVDAHLQAGEGLAVRGQHQRVFGHGPKAFDGLQARHIQVGAADPQPAFTRRPAPALPHVQSGRHEEVGGAGALGGSGPWQKVASLGPSRSGVRR